MKTNKTTEDKRETFKNMAETTFKKHQQKTKNTHMKIERKTQEITKTLDKIIASQAITLKRLQKVLLRMKGIKKTNAID